MNTKITDHLITGLLLGVIAPSIGIFIFYTINFSSGDFSTFMQLALREKLLSPLLSLFAVINLGVFYLFIHFEKYNTSKGIILATFLYGLAIVLLKFF